MDRKRYLCYVILIAMPIVFLLFLLALFSLPLMLVAVLALIIALGMLYRAKPELFMLPDNGPEEDRPDSRPVEPTPHAARKKAYLMLSSISASNRLCITVDQPVFVIGRGLSCQYVLDDQKVSHKHLTVEYNCSDKLCYVTDTSTNGTFLNSVRLKRNTRYALKQGDILQIASAAFSVEYVHF
ncbi:MAG: FHA domain-containing protein [Candidatus Faecivicinus sp.]